MTPGKGPTLIRVLHLEDEPDDVVLVARALGSPDQEFDIVSVDEASDFLRALLDEPPDVILADYSIPGFGGMEALQIAQEHCPDIPFIIVSGTIGEERAVDALKRGAADYIWKDQMQRLPSAVMQAVLGAREKAHSRELAAEVTRNHEQIASLVDSMPGSFFACDSGFLLTLANRGMEHLVGINRTDLIGMPLWDVLPENNREQLEGALSRTQGQRTHSETEEFYPSFNSWFRVSSFPTAEGIAVHMTDVSALRRAELEKDLVDARFRSLMESTPAITYTLDLTSRRTTYISSQVETILGYTKAGWMKTVDMWSTIVHPEDLPNARAVLDTMIASGTPGDATYRIRTRGGDYRWINDRARVVRDDQGSSLQGVMLDVTDRVAAEEERTMLVAILHSTPDFVGIADENGRTIYANPSGLRFAGVGSLHELRAHHLTDFVSPEMVDYTVREAIPYAEQNGTWTGENRFVATDGTEIPVSQVIVAHKNTSGETVRLSMIARDLSKEIELKNEFQRAQRLEAVGRLAGGIAHDFNNLLSVIMNYSDFVKEDLEEGDPKLEDLGEIRKAAVRGAALTRQMLTFSRRNQSDPELIEVDEVVGEIHKMLERSLGADIELRLELASSPWTIMIGESQLEQVLMNLAVNARDAMPLGGTLTFRTFNSAGTGADPTSGHVYVEVTDTGTGMDDETLAHMFEAFYTTKPLDKGTGLGLSTVHGIVEEAGGTIHASSEPGIGTTFTLTFPSAMSGTVEEEPAEVPEPALAGSEASE